MDIIYSLLLAKIVHYNVLDVKTVLIVPNAFTIIIFQTTFAPLVDRIAWFAKLRKVALCAIFHKDMDIIFINVNVYHVI